MASQALVLGGGGPVGIAWEAGMVKGLADAGVDVTAADAIIGTSAGAVVGTQLALGKTPDALYQEQLAPLETNGRSAPEPDIAALVNIGQKWIGGSGTDPKVCAEIGAIALSAKVWSEEEWLAAFRSNSGGPDWPAQRLIVTGVDVESGEQVAWDRAAGVRLDHAVSASCALPGILPPITINGRRYMDGGVHSVSSALLARGHDRIVILAPSGGADNLYDNNTRQQLEVEVKELRADGSTVEYALPDAGSVEAFGPSRMDPERRGPAAMAGLRQGAEFAEQIKATWAASAV